MADTNKTVLGNDFSERQKWFRHRGIDVYGPEKRDDPFRTYMRRFYVYDPAPTLRASHAPLLAIFGELDSLEGVKANVRATVRR